jgi:hypothetical protein
LGVDSRHQPSRELLAQMGGALPGLDVPLRR